MGDVVVSPLHQRRGIGRAIVEDLKIVAGVLGTLTATPGCNPYKRRGWRKLSTA